MVLVGIANDITYKLQGKKALSEKQKSYWVKGIGSFIKGEIISLEISIFALDCIGIGLKNLKLLGFPGGAVVENLPAQCRGHGFEPWSGKIPHAAEQLC